MDWDVEKVQAAGGGDETSCFVVMASVQRDANLQKLWKILQVQEEVKADFNAIAKLLFRMVLRRSVTAICPLLNDGHGHVAPGPVLLNNHVHF